MTTFRTWLEPTGELEIRQDGKRRILRGVFPYGGLAVVSDRGRVRKERIAPNAFDFAINREPERKIDLLVGHDFGAPIANRQTGSLLIESNAEAVTFEATLPELADMPTWVDDAVKAVRAGLMLGLSPGFRTPPPNVVPDAEVEIPEPGNPGVYITEVREGVLREMSLVTAAAYDDASVSLRAESETVLTLPTPRAATLWL